MKKPEGILRQERYLTDFHSVQLYCPSCKKTHSYIELRGSDDWSKDTPDKLLCPNTGNEITHYITLFGGEQFLFEV